jgi:predicted DNA-binding transcriptional regulator AlpA
MTQKPHDVGQDERISVSFVPVPSQNAARIEAIHMACHPSSVRVVARGFVVGATATSSSTAETWSASPGDMPQLLTARELEAMLKIDIKTIYAYVQRGLIPYVKIQSNVRFPKHEILAWIQQQSHRPKGGVVNGSARH